MLTSNSGRMGNQPATVAMNESWWMYWKIPEMNVSGSMVAQMIGSMASTDVTNVDIAAPSDAKHAVPRMTTSPNSGQFVGMAMSKKATEIVSMTASVITTTDIAPATWAVSNDHAGTGVVRSRW